MKAAPRLLTLDEFIKGHKKREMTKSSYIKEVGFSCLYVRIGPRYIGAPRKWYSTLDIANVEVRRKNRGTFTSFINRFQEEYPRIGLYVENVMTERFSNMLQFKLGFIEDPDLLSCFWKISSRTEIISLRNW
jgi:hypothetical protein